jgi:PAS domain-containing protein
LSYRQFPWIPPRENPSPGYHWCRFIDSVRGTELDWSRTTHAVAFRVPSLALVSRYGLAAFLAGLAVLAGLQLATQSSARHLLWPCYPAVMLSAWFGGFGPGLVTTLLSAVALTYVDRTIHSPMIQGPLDLMGLVLFLSVGVLLSTLNAQLLDAQRRADAVTRELRRETDERKTVEAVAAKLVSIVDELQTSVDRYREQMGSLAGVFRARSDDGRIVECNDFFVRLLGASSPQQILALNVKDLLPDPARWHEVARALTPGVVIENQELRWRRDDGAPLVFRASLRQADGFVEGVAVRAAASESL